MPGLAAWDEIAKDRYGVQDPKIVIVGSNGVRVQGSDLTPAKQQAVTDALAKFGEIKSADVSVSDVGPTWGEQVSSKALRALATGGATREEQLPDVPTVAEAGYPDFKALQWIGLLTTGGTPKAIVDRLNAEVQRALQIPEVKARLAEQGMTVAGGPASEFRSLIADEIKQWTEVARKANIRIE